MKIPRAAWAIVLAAVPFHLGLATSTDLSPDEAYYLAAARLGRAIQDHPPLLSWLLRWSDRWTALPVELRVRVWPVLFSALTGLAIVAIAARRGARPEGTVAAAWLGSWALLPTAGGFVATPDGPLLLAVTAALLAPPGVAGIPLVPGALAKVSALPVAAALALDARSWRARVAIALAPALALPWLWPSLRFQLCHAFAQRAPAGWSLGAALGAVVAAVAAQALLWSPPVVWRGFRGLRALPAPDQALAWTLTGLVLLSALVRGVPPEPNWWAPAAIVILAAFAVSAHELRPRSRRLLVSGVVVLTTIAAVQTVQPVFPLPERLDPTARLHGWKVGQPPTSAPGVGVYGPSAERCAYRNDCEEISNYFDKMDVNEASCP